MTSIPDPQDQLAILKTLRAAKGFHPLHLTVDDFDWLVAEVEAGRRLRDKLVEFHDSYDSGTDDRFKVRGRLWRFLAEYDAHRARRG